MLVCYMTLANHDRVPTRGLAIDLTVSMAEFTREDRQEVAAMNVEEQKEAVEGADNAIARRLREMQFRAARPAPVTPAEPQNTPTALAIKACRERDEAVATRDAVTRERDRLARKLAAVSAERDAAVTGRDAAVADCRAKDNRIAALEAQLRAERMSEGMDDSEDEELAAAHARRQAGGRAAGRKRKDSPVSHGRRPYSR